jgi:NTP pyrophosphatase (non-canonical NTP hydrolase)
MTTNFKIQLPHDLLLQLENDVREIEQSGYPEFVQNLMKGMDTPSQEFMHAAAGLAGEGGEVLDFAKKVWVYGKELDVSALIKELGDSRFYYQAILNWLGITDEMVMAQNVKKLRARYSEGKYSDAQAIAQADKTLLGRDRNAAPLARRPIGKE